jgi:hypothetical protein
MISLHHTLFIPAFMNGLFFAIITKTGIDVSPSGIGLMIFDAFQPYVTEQNVVIFRFAELMLLVLPWISIVVIVIRFGIKGLVAYGVIIALSYVGILYFWK